MRQHEVRLRAMSDREYAVYLEELVGRLAELSVAAGRWAADRAPATSRAVIEASLPDGRDTAGRLFLVAEDDEGRVGVVYLGLDAPDGYFPGAAWIHDIAVVPERRGRGLGRALLRAAEREVVSRGRTGLALNVMTANAAAVRLYESAGYATATQTMIKPL